MVIKCWFDGCCEPVNPGGHAAYGALIDTGSKQLKEGKYIGHGEGISNNVAEYSGIIRILEYLKEHNLQNEEIIIYGDSKLVIEQMKGKWKINQGAYVPYALKARQIDVDFPNVTYIWIPREQNTVCDDLSKDVLKNMNIKFRIQR